MVLSTPLPTPPERPRTEVRTQILVIECGQTLPIIIDATDEITKGPQAFPVEYPDEVLRLLTDPTKWIDVWQDGMTPEGERTRLRRRVLSRNVSNIVEATIFPLEENMVQS